MPEGLTYIDVVIKGDDHTFEMEDTSTLSIGRSPQNAVVLDDDSMIPVDLPPPGLNESGPP